MKRCSICKETKDISEFNKKGTRKDGAPKWQTYCKVCYNAYKKQHYLKNKDDYISKNREHRKTIIKWIQDYKSSFPCADCGQYFHFSAMDFDHLKDKKFNISQGGRHGSIKTIQEEISKCEIVCSNCHRVRTWKRNQN